MSVETRTDDNEIRFGIPFENQASGLLVFYRIAKAKGYTIQIEDSLDSDGYIINTAVGISNNTRRELDTLWWKIVNNTRKGNAVWTVTDGALHEAYDTISKEQSKPGYGSELHSSVKVPLRALEECYVGAYEKVDGYRDRTKFDPVRDMTAEHALYKTLIEKGIEPIQPEGIAILLTQAMQELGV